MNKFESRQWTNEQHRTLNDEVIFRWTTNMFSISGDRNSRRLRTSHKMQQFCLTNAKILPKLITFEFTFGNPMVSSAEYFSIVLLWTHDCNWNRMKREGKRRYFKARVSFSLRWKKDFALWINKTEERSAEINFYHENEFIKNRLRKISDTLDMSVWGTSNFRDTQGNARWLSTKRKRKWISQWLLRSSVEFRNKKRAAEHCATINALRNELEM